MRLEYDEFMEVYSIEGDEDAPKIKEIAGAFGWLDLAAKDDMASIPWFLSGVLFVDGRIMIAAEVYGPLYDCAQRAIPIKDDLFVDRVYVDDTETQLCWFLKKEVDGLFEYQKHKEPDVFDRPRYVSPPKTWTTFRGRNRIARLTPIPEVDLVNFMGGYDRLVDDAARGRTGYHPDVPELQKVLRRKPGEIVNHPAVKALVWLHNGLVRSRLFADKGGHGAAPYYGNLKRR
jgi:hypothetical protein